MNEAASLDRMTLEQDQRITDVVKSEQSRLRNFIRRRVPDPGDAEDILQDVFYELIEANRLLMPIQHVTGWLFQVARNRITDLFRKKKPENFSDVTIAQENENANEDEVAACTSTTCCPRPMRGRTHSTSAACSSKNCSAQFQNCPKSRAQSSSHTN